MQEAQCRLKLSRPMSTVFSIHLLIVSQHCDGRLSIHLRLVFPISWFYTTFLCNQLRPAGTTWGCWWTNCLNYLLGVQAW